MADTILSTPADYGEFLRAKIKMAQFSGFTLQAGQMPVPHVRGDEPDRDARMVGGRICSPRAWG